MEIDYQEHQGKIVRVRVKKPLPNQADYVGRFDSMGEGELILSPYTYLYDKPGGGFDMKAAVKRIKFAEKEGLGSKLTENLVWERLPISKENIRLLEEVRIAKGR